MLSQWDINSNNLTKPCHDSFCATLLEAVYTGTESIRFRQRDVTSSPSKDMRVYELGFTTY